MVARVINWQDTGPDEAPQKRAFVTGPRKDGKYKVQYVFPSSGRRIIKIESAATVEGLRSEGYLVYRGNPGTGARIINRQTVILNPARVTQREVSSAAASYHNLLMQYGENNMATQRAEWRYRDLARQYEEQKAKASARRGNYAGWEYGGGIWKGHSGGHS